jgi:hypothetical protein
MLIAHVSLPAADCARVAAVLAEMLEGGALRFPPGGPDAWNAWSKANDLQIVVTPRGHVMVPGPDEMVWTKGATAAAWETHFALCVERPASEVLDIAARAGWQARLCDRGGFFHVVEVWVENAYLVEVLDPSFAAEYRRSMTVENWQRVFGRGVSSGDAAGGVGPGDGVGVSGSGGGREARELAAAEVGAQGR